MAKNKVTKKQQDEQDDIINFAPYYESSYDDEIMSDMMSNLLEASSHQMMLALELTRLAIEKTDSKNMKIEDVFSTFKKASGIVAENVALKALLDKFQ